MFLLKFHSIVSTFSKQEFSITAVNFVDHVTSVLPVSWEATAAGICVLIHSTIYELVILMIAWETILWIINTLNPNPNWSHSYNFGSLVFVKIMDLVSLFIIMYYFRFQFATTFYLFCNVWLRIAILFCASSVLFYKVDTPFYFPCDS